MQPSASWTLKVAAGAVIGLALVALGINAATMTFCEDEANGFYLSKLPLGQVVEMLRHGYHEDPPLSDVILHGWIRVAGFRPWLLRALPVAFWLAALPGVFLCGRTLLGPRGGWFALLALGLMPYHWTIPAAFRWYSLYACLAAWNFWFFLGMADAPRWRLVGYCLTGAALWYTNYSAPILFFAHLLVALAGSESRPLVLRRLVVCWLAIGLLFVPWLPTFLGQLGRSTRPLSASYTAVSFWVLWAGELLSPFRVWALAPAAIGGLLFFALATAEYRCSWAPLSVAGIALAGLLASGAIGPKRLLIVSPFLALGLAAALAANNRRPALRWARAGLAAALVAGCAASWVNLARRSDWAAYRWLDPCQQVVHRIEARSPGALVFSNSNPVFFCLGDEYGKNLCRVPQASDPDYRPAALLFPLELNHEPLLDRAMGGARRLVWVYHSPYHGPISEHYRPTVERLRQAGFRVVSVEPYLRPSAGFLRHHPHFQGPRSRQSVGDCDDYRLVAVFFERAGRRAGSLARR